MNARSNPNLRRKRLPGLLALCAAPVLRFLLVPLRRRGGPEGPLLVFSAYMVGDVFMALPALKRLATAAPLRVLCRPDCAELLRHEGLDPLPFDNAFLTRRTPGAFLRTLRAAWALRRLPPSEALDLDADPRTAFWLRIAGATRITSFRRSYGVLFDETFELPAGAVHQADKDMAVVQAWVEREGGRRKVDDREGLVPSAVHPLPSPLQAPVWLLSVWTRKPEKNWPLERWDEFMNRMAAGGIPFAILEAPDGDGAYRGFVAGWRGRAEIVSGPLEVVAEHVKASAGVVATDNFLGHMAGYYGKPVLWINVSSPAAQVEPRGPRTVRAGAGGPGRPVIPEVDEAWERFEELRS